MTDSSEQYGEFKGSTSTKLEILFLEVKALRSDVNDLKGFKAWAVGFGAAAGFLGAFIKELLLGQKT
jgi:hypothetical protein